VTPRFAAALLAGLVAAAGLALLARSVFAIERDLRAEDARLLAGDLETSPRGGLAARLAERLLGVEDDRSLREALRLVESSRRPGTSVRSVLERHGEAVVRLDVLARSGDDPARRSQAATLAGLLALEDSALDPGSRGRFLELGLDAFRLAVLTDPGNEDAKYNLELVLARLTGPAETRDPGEEQPAPEGRSAGSSDPGSGY
jgi:hypothetical protein